MDSINHTIRPTPNQVLNETMGQLLHQNRTKQDLVNQDLSVSDIHTVALLGNHLYPQSVQKFSPFSQTSGKGKLVRIQTLKQSSLLDSHPDQSSHSNNHILPRCVALTFDDGPNPHVTPIILKILKEHQIHATFFVVGRMTQRYPDLVKQEIKEGHMVGDHSWNHAWMNHLSSAQMIQNLDRTQKILHTLIPNTPISYFRPPYGASNHTLEQLVFQRGMSLVWWSVDDEAYRGYPAEHLKQLVLSETKPGSIILMHDIQPQTAKALDDELTDLTARGIRFCDLPTWQAEEQTELASHVPASPNLVHHSRHIQSRHGLTESP